MKFTLLTTLALTTLTSALPPDYEYRPFATPDLPPAKPHVDLNILWEMCTCTPHCSQFSNMKSDFANEV